MRLPPVLAIASLAAPGAAAASAQAAAPPEAAPGARVALVGGYAGAVALSGAVGPQGRVYVLPLDAPRPLTAPVAENMRLSPGGSPFGLGLPEPLDLVWWTPAAPGGPSFVAAAFSGLKPGGVLRVSPAPEDAARIAAEALRVGFAPMSAAPRGRPALAFRKP